MTFSKKKSCNKEYPQGYKNKNKCDEFYSSIENPETDGMIDIKEGEYTKKENDDPVNNKDDKSRYFHGFIKVLFEVQQARFYVNERKLHVLQFFLASFELRGPFAEEMAHAP